MDWRNAMRVFTHRDLRHLAKARKIRWYSYLNKAELCFRIFGDDAILLKALCYANQCRRYGVREPDDANQWNRITA